MHKKQFHHMHATVIVEQTTHDPVRGCDSAFREVHIQFISYRTLMFDIKEFYPANKPNSLVQRYIIVSPYIHYSPTTTRQVKRFLLEYGFDKSVKRFLNSGETEYHDAKTKTSFRYADTKNVLSDFQFNWFASKEVY